MGYSALIQYTAQNWMCCGVFTVFEQLYGESSQFNKYFFDKVMCESLHVCNKYKNCLKNRIFSVCAPQYVMRPPVAKHVPLHSKSLCKYIARASGANNMRPLSWGGGHKRKRSKKPLRLPRTTFLITSCEPIYESK